LRPEAADGVQPPLSRPSLQVVERGDAELIEEDADLLQAEAGDAEHLENAGWELLAQVIQVARLAGAHELFDHRAGRLTDARYVVDRARCDELPDVGVQRGDRSRRALERARLEAVRLAQVHVRRDLVQRPGDAPLVHTACYH